MYIYKKRVLPVALTALVATGAVGGLAFAQERREADKDAAAIANAKVTLQQAIATAEQQAGGRAVSADIEQERGATRIEVEVAGPRSVSDARGLLGNGGRGSARRNTTLTSGTIWRHRRQPVPRPLVPVPNSQA